MRFCNIIILGLLVALQSTPVIAHANNPKNCNEALTNDLNVEFETSDEQPLEPPFQLLTTDDVQKRSTRNIAPETYEFLREKGPNNQSLAAFVIHSGEAMGEGIAFGTERAMKFTKPSIEDHASIVQVLGGDIISYQYFIKHSQTRDTQVYEEIPVTITVSPLLCGSAVHSNTFSDLDIEATIKVQYDGFKEADLHNENSIAAKALARFFQDYIRTVSVFKLPESGRPFLVDVKAGEFDHIPAEQERTKSRAIKWSRQEIENGYKFIDTKDGKKRIMTLSSALISESRTKVDWIVKMDEVDEAFKDATKITKRYVDANVLFHFAGQDGDNEPVLRIAHDTHIPDAGATGGHLAIKNTGGFAPLRISTVAFNPKHASIANRLSIITPNLHIFYIHAILLNVNRTYRDSEDTLKLLKRVQRRLLYWDDVETFRHYFNNKLAPFDLISSKSDSLIPPIQTLPEELSKDVIYDDIQEIISDSSLRNLLLIKEALRMLKVLREKSTQAGEIDVHLEGDTIRKTILYLIQNKEHFSDYPNHVLDKLRPLVIPDSRFFNPDRAEAMLHLTRYIDIIDSIVTEFVNRQLNERPYLIEYLRFVTDDTHKFEIQDFNREALFVALKPNEDSEFVKKYTEYLTTARKRFPEIEFTLPNDLHMTLTFLGKITPQVEENAKGIIQRYNQLFSEHLQKQPLNIQKGVLRMIGSNHNQIGIVFPLESLPKGLLELIQGMKYELVRAGIVPDRHLHEFLPHISIGYLGNTKRLSNGSLTIHNFMSDNQLPKEMKSVVLPSDINLLKVTEETFEDNSSEDQPRYQQQRLSGDKHFEALDEVLKYAE